MGNKNNDERYLNITLKNDNDEKNEVVISFSGIFKSLKKYFLIWLVTAVVAAALSLAGTAVFANDQHKNMSALISFTYDGIENGLAPDGNVFDINSVKNPAVIEAALTELGQPLELLESVRQNITFEGVNPKDAIDRITVYQSVYESASSGALNAAQAILDTKFYPTQYKVYFNYADSGLDGSDAVQVFNAVLDCYRDYFFETYGYNQALGNAVTALDYTDYDYAEAVDVFETSLNTMKNYVSNLSADDTTRFRSSVTGYTFADLSEAIKAVQAMDLDLLSSYITVNNVTKDKDRLINYYTYRVEALTRQKTIAEETLATITDTINSYEKDTVMIFGNGTENTDTQYSQGSQEYDDLIQSKVDTQSELSTTTQQINFYNQRISALKGKTAASDDKIERVEADLEKLNEKVNTLIENVNKTADEYYETVSFANAYSILVPASASSVNMLKNVINDAAMTILVLEALLFAVYIVFSFVVALVAENKKKQAAASAIEDEPDNDAETEDDSVAETETDNNTAKKKSK